MDYNISEQDIFLFHQGTNYHSHQLLGCHTIEWEGTQRLSICSVGTECQRNPCSR